MNRFLTAAVVGGAALAVGVLPAAAPAFGATPVAPTPIGPGSHSAPGAHQPGSHNPVTHKPVTHQPVTHRPVTHQPVTKKPVGHKPTGSPPGAHQPVGHKPTAPKPAPHQPGSHQPVGHKPVGHQPGSHQPGAHPPVKHQPGGHGPGTPKPVVPKPTGPAPVGPEPVTHQPVTTPANPAPNPGGPVAEPRILGGSPASDVPWAAQVSWDSVGFQCSGTVVAPTWVLTAQHCLTDDGMSVRVGTNKLGAGTVVRVDSTVADPAGDLALLHLANAVDVTPVMLADTDPAAGTLNQIYGWGKTSPTSGPAHLLRTAQVKVTGTDCQDAVGGPAICSTGVDGSAFSGDSGGPEMAGGTEVGVCSTGNEAGTTQQYASVAAARDWIRQTAEV